MLTGWDACDCERELSGLRELTSRRTCYLRDNDDNNNNNNTMLWWEREGNVVPDV
jgi:hypothetical protein